MHNYKASVLFRHDYINDEGECLISIRFTVNGKRWVKSLQIHCPIKEWDFATSRVKRYPYSEWKVSFNLIIETALSRAKEIFLDAQVTNNPLTIQTFRKKYDDGDKYLDFIDFMRNELKRRVDSRQISESTARIDESAIKQLLYFQEEIRFIDLTDTFFRSFEAHYFNTGKRPRHQNNLRKYLKKYSLYIDRAIQSGINITNPLKGRKKASTKTDRTALTPDELHSFIQLRYTDVLTYSQREVLEAMIFSASNGGFRISDIRHLGRNNLNNGVLSFVPYKTRAKANVLVNIQINEFGQRILSERKMRDRFFDLPTDQHVNKMLKELCLIAGIKKKVTSHVFRHTYASIYVNCGGLAINLASIMGITLAVAIDYVHAFQQAASASNKLLDTFFKPLYMPGEADQRPLASLPGQESHDRES